MGAQATPGAGDSQPIDPPRERLFGTTIYQKGGWVVAMLRYLVGDEAFFAGVRTYLTENAYGTGTTEKFKTALEA